MDLRLHVLWVVSVLVCLLSYLLLDAVCRPRSSRSGRTGRRHRHRMLTAAGTTLVAVPVVPAPAVSMPVTTVLSPSIAGALLCHIHRVRREQSLLRDGTLPRRLNQEEMRALSMLVQAAGERWSLMRDEHPDTTVLPPEVRELLAAVESREEAPSAPEMLDWRVLVRLVGEPVVENNFGERAVFGKKKALELLAWIVLNKDRSSRSAARTALWDEHVTDSTFSTVVSDMRRALGRIAPLEEGKSWSPVTYTDALPVMDGVITDVDLLVAAASCRDRQQLRSSLELVRDLPFCGTAWLWPDLDGSTTRAVIAVSIAVKELLVIAEEDGNRHDMELAIRAGLRVQPGDEELLLIQREVLERFRSRGGTSSRSLS